MERQRLTLDSFLPPGCILLSCEGRPRAAPELPGEGTVRVDPRE